MLTGACRRVPLVGKLARVLRRWQAGGPVSTGVGPRRRWRRRAADRRSTPLPYWNRHLLAPWHNLRASWLQADPRKTKEKGLDFFGFLWSNWDFSRGYEENKRKNPLPAQLASEVVRKRHPGRIATVSRTSDPSILNWSPQKHITCVSGFVNESDCGSEVGGQIRMSREAPAGSRPDPGGDEERVLVRRGPFSDHITAKPAARRSRRPWVPCGRGSTFGELKAGGRRAERAHCESEFVAWRADDGRACNDRFRRSAMVNSAVLIAHSGSKTVQLTAFLKAPEKGPYPATLWRRIRLTDAGSGGKRTSASPLKASASILTRRAMTPRP
jgi:hypothetical protein